VITPNKFTDLDSSILAKLEIILDGTIGDTSIRDLYHAVAHRFETADEFLLALDVLYILGRVNVDFKTATVSDVA
jgi:hypothetical protein